MNELDKEELLEAIKNYDVFTKKQRGVLQSLVSIEIDNIATITTASLATLANVSVAAIYKALKVFSDEGYITNISDSPRKIYKFKLNKSKLEEIKEIYKKIKKVRQK